LLLPLLLEESIADTAQMLRDQRQLVADFPVHPETLIGSLIGVLQLTKTLSRYGSVFWYPFIQTLNTDMAQNLLTTETLCRS